MKERLSAFERHLITEEKSAASIEKYLRDVRCFLSFLGNRTLCKEETIAFKEHLTAQYAPVSVNSMLIALNGFLRFVGQPDCCGPANENPAADFLQ